MFSMLITLLMMVNFSAQAEDAFVCMPRTHTKEVKQSSKEAVQQFEQTKNIKLSDKEILTRLILAETLNTNYFLDPQCQDQGDIIAKAIAWGAMNRVRSGRSDWNTARKTAFADQQFAPAISPYSIFADIFTCPTLLQQDAKDMSQQKTRYINYVTKLNRLADYQKYIPLTLQYARAAADEAFNYSTDKNPFILAKIASPVENFYYPLSDDVKWGNPDWNRCNQPLDNIEIDGKKLKPYCIRFFHKAQINSTKRCPASVSDTKKKKVDLKKTKPKTKS